MKAAEEVCRLLEKCREEADWLERQEGWLLTEVKPGRLEMEPFLEKGPAIEIEGPEEVSEVGEKGWQIELEIGRGEQDWRIVWSGSDYMSRGGREKRPPASLAVKLRALLEPYALAHSVGRYLEGLGRYKSGFAEKIKAQRAI